MELRQAQTIAQRVKAELAPHCERIEVAGSVRRRKPEVKDLEIVCIPQVVSGGLCKALARRKELYQRR